MPTSPDAWAQLTAPAPASYSPLHITVGDLGPRAYKTTSIGGSPPDKLVRGCILGELRVKQGASRSQDARVAARELHAAIGDSEAKLIIFYCSPAYDLDALGAALCELFGADAPLIGCTTAGEITPLGYLEGSLTGVSLGGPGFRAATTQVNDLRNFEFARGDAAAQAVLEELRGCGVVPSGERCFGFLLADGLSMQEEPLVSAIYRNLGDIQLFGGSAGDGTRFAKTSLYYRGRFSTDCALFTLVCTDYPFRVFKTEHFLPSEDKMVVTGADPAHRIVTEINGEPAGREYARLVGLEVDKLTPLIFAAYPVVVKVGGSTFVRSIQKVNDDESLTFFCAIDEGIVLTVAKGVDLFENLEAAFTQVRREIGEPTVVLGCDCILRFIETGQRGLRERVGELFAKNRVIGFSTYGEQFNAMHVNQTFTGVAIGSR
jgi:hypothetical protein